MSDERGERARRFLDVLEREEAKLLAWGVVDGGFNHEELAERAEELVDASGWDCTTNQLLRDLFDRRLLFLLQSAGGPVYRTRMAEAVRLFSRLRQLFPNRRWELAPTLVADFRFDRRDRRYPVRYLGPSDVFAALDETVALSPLKREALSALLRAHGPMPLKLAEFQSRALTRLLLDLEARYSRGLLVGAGTGTGKTLAFYLPALTHIAGLVERSNHWTKAIAIYPRNELLKDQFSETYTEARRLDTLLDARSGRKITIGAFFGPTPRDAQGLKDRDLWPRQQAEGFLCPYLRCPRCEGPLLWRSGDIDRGVEALNCTSASCGATVGGDEVILTRGRMSRTPPDILFTTTEMLNRQMGDSRYGHIFGLGPGVRRPQIMLLDEVHTYDGTSGAQVALLLRRWRHAIGSKVQFTGLSATLRAATEFFGDLVGLGHGSVEEVSPRQSELDKEAESVEYVLALRGDPGSGTSLLSTTIQAAMLLRRTLDPAISQPSGGLFGRRVFVFTDDLDVTNRLYNNLQDAEGLDSWNRVEKEPLAALRSVAEPENFARLLAGQSWQLCEDIGHPFGLRQPLHVGRTSSQDTGVERGSDVVVATAALEVGYNDPDVGAVIQHKAPRDWAAFLQRKGRAGRSRMMRPWTGVILSDYGRDRLAYQAYDQLFDPELPHRSLPVRNRYVLRMQGAFALMDWLASRARPPVPKGSLWRDLSGPAPEDDVWWAEQMRARQEWIRVVLRELVDGVEETSRSLATYLRASLAITEEETQAILWDPPRPLLAGVVPTLLRRIETGWKRVPSHPAETTTDIQVDDHPLPDFVPKQLFSDLNLPEVELVIPRQTRLGTDKSHFMPIVQALRTLAPGRVTRRFGYEHEYANHWVAPPDLFQEEQLLAVEDFASEFHEEGHVQIRVGSTIKELRCVRPWKVMPTAPPKSILNTSNAQLLWHSQLSPAREDERLRFGPPRDSAWGTIIRDVLFFTHNQHTHVEVRRFAVGSRAGVRFRDGTQLDATVRFVERDSREEASVGFTQESDGVVFRYQLPDDLGLSPDHPNRRKVRSFRSILFHTRVQEDTSAGLPPNIFQREWLAQIYLSALLGHAVREACSLEAAHRALHPTRAAAEMERVLEVIFLTLEDPDGGGDVRQRVHDILLDLARDQAVIDTLGALASVLWSPPDGGWQREASARFKATLGGALLEACQQTCPQMEASDLILDLDPGPRPPGAVPVPEGGEEIWITESTLGGGGVIEEILRAYASDPRQFYRLAESALGATDFEVVDRELTRILDLAVTNPEIEECFARVRAPGGNEGLRHATTQLRAALSARGITVNHAVASALHARVLRPGSSSQSDQFLRTLVQRWEVEEGRLGIEIDPRVFAFVAGEDPHFKDGLAAIGSVPADDPSWRFQAIYGLLWPRGSAVRADGLSFYNPFAGSPPPDREILLDLIRAGDPTVRLGPGWLDQVQQALATHGTVRLTAMPGDRQLLKEAVLALAAEPLEVEFLHLYPRAAKVTVDPGELSITLDMREVYR